MTQVQIEFLKTGLSLGVSIFTIGLGWIVGQRLTLYWNLRLREREQDLASAHEFQKLYGEFFAVWKLWNHHHKRDQDKLDRFRSELMKRICTAEGELESLFVRLASSRELACEQTEMLGRFRQLYQTLRELIRADRPLDWRSSDHPEYVQFKKHATQVASLIASDAKLDAAVVAAREDALLRITTNSLEDNGRLHGEY
jgi:hypothetical protein